MNIGEQYKVLGKSIEYGMQITPFSHCRKSELPTVKLSMKRHVPIQDLPEYPDYSHPYLFESKHRRPIAILLAKNGILMADLISMDNYCMAGVVDHYKVIHWWLFTRLNGIPHPDFFAAEFYDAAFQYLDSSTQGGIQGVYAWWDEGTNYDAFNNGLRSGMCVDEAALSTWSGKQAALRGFTQIESKTIMTPDEDEYRMIFRRPTNTLSQRR